ncbi:MAG: hypothetical protein PW792_02775 [Acidobacteriaceae bacterium]|nr:hypothetical protein [Acidobacteriaceae bacterium]
MFKDRIQRWTVFALLLISIGAAYRGYFVYHDEEMLNGIGNELGLAAGHGLAPFQYRVGVLWPAYFLYEHGVTFRHSFGVFDLIALTVVLLLGYRLLVRKPLYRSASLLRQVFFSVLYCGMASFLISWQDLYKKFETAPTAMLLMLLLWLFTSREEESPARPERPAILTLLLVFVVSLAQALVRAEIGMAVGLGVLGLRVFCPWARLSLSRNLSIVAAFVMMFTAGTTQLVMSRIVYPHAHYPAGAFFMLFSNLRDVFGTSAFLLMMPPLLWLYWRTWKKPLRGDGAGLAFLLGSLPFLGLWLLIGRTGEVRIFIPFGLALLPYLCQTFSSLIPDSAPQVSVADTF